MRASWLCLAIVFFSRLGAAQLSTNWSEGEHLELGESGSQLACAELGLADDECPTRRILRADRKIAFTYAELLAAADYYKTPDDLYRDRRSGVKKIILCAYRLQHEHPTHAPDRKKYPDCSITGVLHMPGHLNVISHNYDHFAWNNMKAYLRHHSRALAYAREAFARRGHPEESRRAMEKALIFNAFADHYLTDAFPAGHVRTPRVELERWAKRNLPGFLRKARGDLLAILLHDNEGRDLRTGHERGLLVRNSLGHVWTTRSDQYMRVDDDRYDPVFTMPLTALKRSFQELLIAARTGRLPSGEYAATAYVPFAIDVPLARKFSPERHGGTADDVIHALRSTLPPYLRVLSSKADLRRLLRQMPEIFTRFQNGIAADLQADPELSRRLPSHYIDAMLRIE